MMDQLEYGMSDDAKIMSFERAFLITILLFGVALLWCCVMGKEGSSPQPRTYTYSGDTVATEEDRNDEGEDNRTVIKPPSPKSVTRPQQPQQHKSPQIPNEIVLDDGSEDCSDDNIDLRDISGVESIASVMIAISGLEEEEESEEDHCDSPV